MMREKISKGFNSVARVAQSASTTMSPKAKAAKERLLAAATMSREEIFETYDTNLAGYQDEDRVEAERERYGENKITQVKKDSLFKELFDAFVNPFSIVLIGIATISFVTDVILAPAGDKDPVPAIIVLTLVALSGILRFTQEARSSKAAERLSEMVETTIMVARGGDADEEENEQGELPIDEIVVGDIVYLAAGDMIPADVRILQAKDLFVSQSSLTGESEPVEKFTSPVYEEDFDSGELSTSTLDYNNLAFMGTNIISGSATAIVIAVGDDTIFGQVAHQVTEKKPKTSFELGVNSVSWVLIRFMLVMVPLVFVINGFTKGDWMQAFLFAITVAVGLTPEMLPTIVSANLAKGAVSMSKKKVIVKNLNSIQNFGAMDILCTDKTGTITQDKVVLEYYLDVDGHEDNRILRHAFLNSYYQTGLRNLMDVAIIEHAHEAEVNDLVDNYKKLDEIPFDFQRRRMSVVVADKTGKRQLITKGAIEEMMQVCSFVEHNGVVQDLTDERRKEILSQVAGYNDDGLRVLGIAQKTNPPREEEFSVADEHEMVLIGYLAFLDPPKESTGKAISALLEYGVTTKVLTGDNDAVTRAVCRQVGLEVDSLLLGSDVDAMSEEELDLAVEETNVFAKLSPQQKVTIVQALRRAGHSVGFMGDGINDAAAMKESDVGISVDTAVDIAKESADIILMEKDLMVLERGVIEGRKTYANIIKYIKMTASSNFGNMFAVLAASAFLPFLPMLPVQILLLNLIYDISCIAIPWDNVDEDYLKVPRDWSAGTISKFMIWLGPVSSIFDIATYLVMYFILCPLVFGGPFETLGPLAAAGFVMLFHTGWFVESLWSQTLVIHMIRTPHLPFIKSRASWQLTMLTTLGIIFGTVVPYTPLGGAIGMYPLPPLYFVFLVAIIVLYMLLITVQKKLYIRKYGELL